MTVEIAMTHILRWHSSVVNTTITSRQGTKLQLLTSMSLVTVFAM